MFSFSSIGSLPSNCYTFFTSSHHINNSPFSRVKTLDELAEEIFKQGDPEHCRKWESEVKQIIEKWTAVENPNKIEDVHLFLKKITKWGVEKNPSEILLFVKNIVSIELMNKIALQQKDYPENCKDLFELALALFDEEMAFTENMRKNHFYEEWNSWFLFLVYIIPNLIDIIFSYFNVLDWHQKYTTIFEKNMMLDSIHTIIKLPFTIINFIEKFFGIKEKVHFVASIIILISAFLLACYQRWFRPQPNHILNCVNRDQKSEKISDQFIVAKPEELTDLITALDTGQNVLILGEPGAGKSALVKAYLQRKKKMILPSNSLKKSAQEIKCEAVTSRFEWGSSDVLDEMKKFVKGYEDKFIFICDEFAIPSNANAFADFIKKFLEDEPRTQTVILMTNTQLNQLKKVYADSQILNTFLRRISTKIMIDADDEKHADMILNRKLTKYWDVPITEKGQKAILEKSKISLYGQGERPARIAFVLDKVMAQCRISFSDVRFTTSAFLEAERKLAMEQLRAREEKIPSPETLAKKIQAQKELDHFSKEREKLQKKVSLLKKHLEVQERFNRDNQKLICLLSNSKSIKEKSLQKVTKEDQVTFLWYRLYGINEIKSLIQTEVNEIKDKVTIQVDEELVNRIFEKESKQCEILRGQKETVKVLSTQNSLLTQNSA